MIPPRRKRPIVLHLLYLLAFTLLAFIAVGNLIRNLMRLGRDAGRNPATMTPPPVARSQFLGPIHPEMLDDRGQPIREPLLVMKSISLEDARDRLRSLYEASPNATPDEREGPPSA